MKRLLVLFVLSLTMLRCEAPVEIHDPTENGVMSTRSSSQGHLGIEARKINTAQMPENLVAHWTSDETAGTTLFDISGNGHHGAIQGGVTLNQPGFDGQAYLFNGTTGVVVVPNHPDLNFGTGEFTIAARINSSQLPTNSMHAISKYRKNAGGHGWLLTVRSNDFLFDGRDGSTTGGTPPQTSGYFSSGSSLTLPQVGAWQHIVGRMTATSIEIWVNGAFESGNPFGSGPV